MKKLIGMHLVWFVLAAAFSVRFGTPRYFQGSLIVLALFFDTGGLYVLSVLAPALIYYLILIGPESVPDHALKGRLLGQLLIASAIALVLSMTAFFISTQAAQLV